MVLPRRSGTGEIAAVEYWLTIRTADLVALNPQTGSVRTLVSLPEVLGLPERFDPYRFTGDRIWGVLRDELDVASVAWIETPGTD